MPKALRYVIGLGSNLGDRRALLEQAAHRIGALGRVTAKSALYESAALGGPEQGPFVNGAVALETELEPRDLLRALLDIERELGRERRERWGPRTLDLDILWGEGLRVVEPGLRIPHERLGDRTFALGPLLDVAPDAESPEGQQPYAERLSQLEHPRLTRLAGAEDWAKGVGILQTTRHHAVR